MPVIKNCRLYLFRYVSCTRQKKKIPTILLSVKSRKISAIIVNIKANTTCLLSRLSSDLNRNEIDNKKHSTILAYLKDLDSSDLGIEKISKPRKATYKIIIPSISITSIRFLSMCFI